MMGNFTTTIEPYLPLLYVLHIIISIVLSVFLTKYIQKRFINDEVVKMKDLLRLEQIEDRSLIFRLFFKISLHKNNTKVSFLFLFLFNIAIPVLGYPLCIWTAWYLYNVTYDKTVAKTNILNLDEFGISFLKIERIFGEGSLIDLMTSKYAPKSKKLKALSALATRVSPENLRVVRETLTSKDDEIRMFGYAILNKAEKALSMKINTNLEIFHEENNKETDINFARKAASAQELATLYWEMVYTELSHESLKKSFLDEVSRYVQIAKDYYVPRSHVLQKKLEIIKVNLEKSELLVKKLNKREIKEIKTDETPQYYKNRIKEIEIDLLSYNNRATKLFLLMGRVYLSNDEYENASTEFTVAQELYQGEASFILPYIAEIQFLMGNYSVVNSIINESPELGLNARLFPIVEQWKIS
ncbi:hypothetical protein JHD46_01850 [Sulfurimonas sp. SAG-AH-194-C20]|nr:hypothetical protein [Sulfurimonas sp. SAG-AH-194-C20]MDF1878378.1 hypothetical protein [Sulfurimonas sp. SAG-AH-194-C20]